MRVMRLVLIVMLALGVLTGCGNGGAAPASADPEGVLPASLEPVDLGPDERLSVVATTSIVADVVANVGGDRIELIRLMPLGVDPHAFEPTPRDMAASSDADVIFINGAGLEIFLSDLLEVAGEQTPVISVSRGIDFLPPAEGHEHAEGEDDHEDEAEVDPHVWFDPNNVKIWVENIRDSLIRLDPDNADVYEANAADYMAQLEELNAWMQDQVNSIPKDRRNLVTDHAVFTYFVNAYGFDQVGVVIPGASTLSEPSARELAALAETITEDEVPAIFVSTTVDPRLAEQVAQDTGIEVVSLYTGSLSSEDEPAATYLDFMRYNMTQIVDALR